MNINPIVIDLSHYDGPGTDYVKAKAAGVVGVIYKASQAASYQDPTYNAERTKALKAGLKWGAYHFGEKGNVQGQVANFVQTAQVDPDSLFCLDFEPYDSNTMSLDEAKQWITDVENQLGRTGECVIYSGNQIKEDLGNKVDTFFGSRRLWLAQYGSNPTVQASWQTFWLWQYTGDGSGPAPHTIDGCNKPIDISSYQGSSDQLAAEWASGQVGPVPPPPPPPPSDLIVTISINAPPGVQVKVLQSELA
jgi:lysozyme